MDESILGLMGKPCASQPQTDALLMQSSAFQCY